MNFTELLNQIINQPIASLSIIINLILIESLLSIDNAAVLATIVLDLPKDQRQKALKYGIVGAYAFRGLCLLFASMLIKIWWFKPLGGIYLLFLSIKYFIQLKKTKDESIIDNEEINKEKSWIYKNTFGILGKFWSTILLVELMDLAFSIDNVIAANAYSNNIILIWTGVFIGILAMRFVAQKFVQLMERFHFLNHCAYLVIALLGVKLTLSLFTHFNPCHSFTIFLEGSNECTIEKGLMIEAGKHEMIWGDFLTSLMSILIFVLPILGSRLFNFPKQNKAN